MTYWNPVRLPSDPADIELQLLVIDFGEVCAVKVEESIWMGLAESVPRLTINDYDAGALFGSNVFLVSELFEKVRAAIDALEEKPPVPRIEKDNENGEMVLYHRDVISHLRVLDYNAFSQLAGKPLPIWTPTQGEWSQIVPFDTFIERPERRETDSGKIERIDSPVEIWRYTRRKV